MNEQKEYGAQRGGQWRIVAWGGVAGLIVFAWVMQRLTGAPYWTVGDYVFAAVLLATPVVICEIAARRTRSWSYRAAAGTAAGACVLLVWVNLAVGIIGSEDNEANLMYVALLLVAVSGAFIARFKADGLDRTMRVVAIGQVLIALIALVGDLDGPETGPIFLIMINGFFFVFWVAASQLFAMAAEEGV